MGDNRNFAALDWVMGEIGETLKEARQALEAFVEDPRDTARMRFCVAHIHQVYGSLQMVEFHGAALFAEEMELLAGAMASGQVPNDKESQEVLMRSLLQLPLYLDQVKARHEDHLGVVLPLLNDIRAVRKQNFLSETNLFNPNLSAAANTGERHAVLDDAEKLPGVLKKLREMFQFAAASVLRGVKIDENLTLIDKVMVRLEGISRGTRSYPIWQVSAALTEALVRDDVELSVAVRTLLRHIAKRLKDLEELGGGELEKLDEGLLRNLLFYVARARQGGTRIRQVKQQYGLDTALMGGASDGRTNDILLSGPDPAAIRAVVVALQDELNSAKHLLDLGLSGQGGLADIEEMIPVIKRISDTLAVLGIGDMRKQTLEQFDALTEMSAAGEISEDVLMRVAARLADLEHRLEVIAKGAGGRNYLSLDEREVQIDDAKQAVLMESRSAIDHVKEAIVESISNKWDPSPLARAVTMLFDVRGGLAIVPLPRPAAILNVCARYIDEQLLHKDAVPGDALQLLAEAIASVDYFLERLLGGHGDDLESYLEMAEDSLSQLGYPVDHNAEATAPARSGARADADEADSDEELAAEATEDDADFQRDFAAEMAADEHAVMSEAHSADVEAEVEAEADAEPAMYSGDFAAEQAQSEYDQAPHTDDDAAQSDAAEEESDSDNHIDAEIIEIFVEEATEVLETLGECFPRWRANFSDQDALITLRRSFHTLKGSGRMVEAREVGEVAWSVENMLNRIIDGSQSAKPAHALFIERVLGLIPKLVTAFERKRKNPEPELTAQYIAWGEQLTKGQIPTELLHGAPSAPAEAHDDSEAEALAADAAEDDNQILFDIFASEAESHLGEIDGFVWSMERAAPLYHVPTDTLQRALHTLKGSAHMAGVTPIAAMVAPLESFIKELRAYQVRVDDDIVQLLKDSSAYTREGLAQIRARGGEVSLPKHDQFLARVQELYDAHLMPLIHHDRASPGQPKVDPRMLAIFMAEEMQLLLDAHERVEKWRGQPADVDELDAMANELNLLSEGAAQAKLPALAELAAELNLIYTAVEHGSLPMDEALFRPLELAHDTLLNMVDAVAAAQNVASVEPELQTALNQLLERAAANEAAQVAEQTAIAAAAAEQAAAQAALDEAAAEVDEQQFDHDQFGRQTFDDAPAFETTAAEEAAWAETVEDASFTESAAATSAERREDLAFTDGAEDSAFAASAEDNAFADSAEDNAFAASAEDMAFDASAEDAGQALSAGDRQRAENQERREAAQAERTAVEERRVAADRAENEALDRDILEIFLEEAGELIEELDEAIHKWESGGSPREASEVMQRALHTLKGGARLANLHELGELTHDYETHVINAGETEGTPEYIRSLHNFQDAVLTQVKSVRAQLEGELAPAPAPVAAAEPVKTPVVVDRGRVVPFVPRPAAPEPMIITAKPQEKPFEAPAQSNKKQGPQEMIKVSAELLEELVNLAGETSISRGRLEQQVNDLTSAVDEVEATLRRLNDQLRRLDMETEAQVSFRQEQMAQDDQFDPLEMDRYSHLQQLTRSLMESASDLFDLKSTLADKLRDTETLLLQQSRINSSLQEGLMRSRMVPFSRLVPRLRRIVRQVAGELGKQVNFELDNVEGEMDRSVLERMVAPLEHMLRNAVDHGIEQPGDRSRKQKPETGRILLSLTREGGDILLRLADDGRGINLQRVRQKALERGLMREDAELSDREVMQFILQAGFSTAENITQISGRGVGMDVVAAEIKQLGGSVTIDSEPEVGTQFTVRLPFTVSVNRALMVQLGQETYAIPLNTIEGIVRVSPFELEHYYSHPEARFEYAGENYQVRHLGAVVTPGFVPRLEGQVLPMPVILVRSAQNTMALQVDSLQGSREIVVKSLGPQFSAVQGLSGATVMGDGSVVVILDPHALVRREMAMARLPQMDQDYADAMEAEAENTLKTVMVVDDSVTVRKVTTRFLEREGYNVITAKDGIDALQVLQEEVPDLMLLDIEMPRMDGFETAKTIRSTSNLKHIPIIMITSRTGDKHRQHALSIGVNEYLGKPYQEEQLLRLINSLVHKQTLTA